MFQGLKYRNLKTEFQLITYTISHKGQISCYVFTSVCNEATSFLAFQYLSFHLIIKQGLLSRFPNFCHFVSFIQKIFKLGTPSQNCNFGRLHRNFLRDIFYLTIQHWTECQYKNLKGIFSFPQLFIRDTSAFYSSWSDWMRVFCFMGYTWKEMTG